MDDKLARLKSEGQGAIASAPDEKELEAVRVRLLGKKGELTTVLKGLGELPEEQRRAVGKSANELKEALSAAIEARRAELARASLDRTLSERIDLSLPGQPLPRGAMHPVNRTADDIVRYFHGLGFEVVDGPELESDYYNFEALNIPDYHPARDTQDSFYVGDKDPGGAPRRTDWMLRTQTSNVQVRVMEKRKPPIRILSPGRVYRRDNDVTHSPLFHQIEGFMVDTHVTFGHLKEVLTGFLRHIFGPERKVRFRPSYFPFVEPGAEVDVSCFCNQKGDCRVCRGGWLEVLGAGMIHPNVLKAGGQDPEAYTGFAFGMGVDRLAMLRYKIPNIRMLFENDVRFLEQF
jgi:phenylalanyl-tRNA synthetase alpha chain